MDWLNREALANLLLRITPALFEWAMMLLPLTLYLIWLGFEVGRKKKPYLVPGAWDTLLLILALSGLLFLGPLTWVISHFAEYGILAYGVAYAVYLIIVAILCFGWIVSRRQSLVVYNIDPNAFQLTFMPILDNAGVPYQMTPGHIAFAEQQLLIDLEPMPRLFCVTISWVGDQALWACLESALRPALAEIHTTRNPAGAILPLYASLLLCFISMSTVLFVWYIAFIF